MKSATTDRLESLLNKSTVMNTRIPEISDFRTIESFESKESQQIERIIIDINARISSPLFSLDIR